ncbi:MAG: hypothetical protein ACYS1C_10040, partial [Planctomycetota bacterium]
MRAPALRSGVLAALTLLVCCPVPCAARSRFVEGDYDYDILYLESHGRVVTWEEAGSRVFIALRGAVIRQGPVRLAAPRMVVWFDKAESARPDVRAARVRVYAQGLEG